MSLKHDSSMPAKDLYRSELFRRRRLWAEASGRPWWIVSAEYGLVDPDQVIAPYDTRIAHLPLPRRHELAAQVAAELDHEIGPLTGKVLELHAGDEYFLTIAPTLRARGARVVRPLEGLRIGEQLGWYGEHLGLASETTIVPRQRQPAVLPADLIGDGRGLGHAITALFMAGDLDLTERRNAPRAGWKGMPEVRAVDALRALGMDGVTIRLFVTFNAAMDRARDADLLTDAAVAMLRAEPWSILPEEVTRRPLGVLTDTLRRYRVSQRHRADAFAWRVIAETLSDPSAAPAAHGAIYAGAADAVELMDEVATTSSGGTELFPLLGGPKISALWIRLLAYPGGAQISSLAEVPVAVDVQVRKVTEYLGVTDTGGLPLEDVRAPIQETWAWDVAAYGAEGPGGLANTPGALDPALWFYAKWGCTFCQAAGAKRPISPLCAQCRFPATRSREVANV